MEIIKNRYQKTIIRKEVTQMTVTPEELKREYNRKWRQTHKENVKAINARYWAKKAAQINAAAEEANTDKRKQEE